MICLWDDVLPTDTLTDDVGQGETSPSKQMPYQRHGLVTSSLTIKLWLTGATRLADAICHVAIDLLSHICLTLAHKRAHALVWVVRRPSITVSHINYIYSVLSCITQDLMKIALTRVFFFARA